jgi:hypothetical protein
MAGYVRRGGAQFQRSSLSCEALRAKLPQCEALAVAMREKLLSNDGLASAG